MHFRFASALLLVSGLAATTQAQEFGPSVPCNSPIKRKVMAADAYCGYGTTGLFDVGLIWNGNQCKWYIRFVQCNERNSFERPKGKATGDGPRS